MRLIALLFLLPASLVFPQQPQAPQAPAQPAAPPDPIATMVGRLDLEKYKATIKGLTQFGDRRQGTDRNRQALDWIEAQLRSYGCANTERITYDYQPPAGRGGAGGAPAAGAGGAPGAAAPDAGAGDAALSLPPSGQAARAGAAFDSPNRSTTTL